VSPLALQTQTCQKNNLVLKTMVRDKFIFSSIRLKEVCREIQAIERSCVCFVCPVIFIDSNGYTLCLSSTKKFEGNCLTFLADAPLQPKIRHPWLAEAPESSIWNNLLWIFHYSNCLERSFGTPNAYNYQTFRSRAHPARMQLYYLPDLRFTLDLKYCSYEYSFSRSLKWLSRNHNAHKLPKSRTLSIKVFFSPKAKEFKRRNEAGR